MSSLPHISHHLFVAAVGHGHGTAMPSDVSNVSNVAADRNVRAPTEAIALELLDSGKPSPADARCPLSASSPVAR